MTEQQEFHPFQYFFNLEDSLVFDKLLISDYPDVAKVRDELWPALRVRFKKNIGDKKAVFGLILCNLKEGLFQLKPIAISRNRNDYRDGRYKQLHLSYHDVIPVLDALIETGMVHSASGYFDQDQQRGRTTRIWAGKRLMENLLQDLNGKRRVRPVNKPELVVLKDKRNKKKLVFEETDFTRDLRAKLEEYHAFMETVKIESSVTVTHPVIFQALHRVRGFLPEEFSDIPCEIPQLVDYARRVKNYLDSLSVSVCTSPLNQSTTTISNNTSTSTTLQTNQVTNKDIPSRSVVSLVSHLLRRIGIVEPISPYLKAVFNRGTFFMGGRLYSGKNGWQNISKLDRSTITFDGKPTVEPDFSGLHINMLYAMAKQPAPPKPYDMVLNDETMRPIVKKMMLVAINTKNDEETIGVMRDDREELRIKRKKTGGLDFKEWQMYCLHNKRTTPWWELLEQIKEVHAPIKQYLCTDRGGELMNRDSKIILDVILTLIREGIPCLPVHDSVVVPTENKDRAREVMREVFFNHMGSECEVKF